MNWLRAHFRFVMHCLLLLSAVATVFASSVQLHWHQHLRAPLAQVYLADLSTPHEARDGDYDMDVQGSEHRAVSAVPMPDLLPMLLLVLPALLLFPRVAPGYPRVPMLARVAAVPRLRPPLRAPPR